MLPPPPPPDNGGTPPLRLLAVICIVGGPNSNDYNTNRILHHTIGLPDFTQELRCFQTVTCYHAVVNNLEDAHELIDTAISTVLMQSKHVYISISCNLSAIPHPTFSREPVPFSLSPNLSNQAGLAAAVEATAEFLNRAVKPMLVVGPKLRKAKAGKAFVELADACGYPIAVMPSAKGLVQEHHPRFIGTYWGAVSTAFCAEILESADAYLFVGPIFNDYSSVGYFLLLKKEKAIIVQPERVVVANGPAFGCVLMKDFFRALAKRLRKNETAFENYERIYVAPGVPGESQPGESLKVKVLFKHIQKMLSGDTAVISETGDSWFNCQKLRLPAGCGYEFQMQYGSIGWSVGATLGYAQAAKRKRVIACIGDGSFQVTAQDASTMLRYGHNTIIFLINNDGYTIEVEIHDGPYNVINNWNYTALVEVFDNGQGKCWTTKVRTEELKVAIETMFKMFRWSSLLSPRFNLRWCLAFTLYFAKMMMPPGESMLVIAGPRPSSEWATIPFNASQASGAIGKQRTSSLDAPIMLLTGHQGTIYTMKFSPCGTVVASGSHDKDVFLWNVHGECKNFMVLRGHKNAILDVQWTTDGNHILSSSADSTLRAWDVETGKQIKRMVEHRYVVNSCNPLRRGPPLVVSGSDDATIKLWDLRQRGSIQTLTESYQVTAVCFSDAADKIYSGGIDNDVKVWDLRRGEKVMTLQGHSDMVTGMQLSPDGSYLLTNSMDCTLRIWDMRPYAPQNRCVKIFAGHQHNFEKNLLRCAWSPDGSKVSAGSADRMVYIWDTTSRRILFKLPGHNGSVNETAFHPVEPVIGSCSSDKQIYLGEI